MWLRACFILVFLHFTQSENCDLPNGVKGQCIPIRNCPSALQQIRRGESPVNCGFDGLQPIVCCQQTLLKSKVGTIANRKCNETMASNRFKRQLPSDMDIDAIVGGFDSPPFEYPHMAALGFGEWPQVSWACGGSLISQRFVLTAAHCINSPRAGKVRYIRLGDLDLSSNMDNASPQNFNISRTIIHPDYKAPAVYNDIALIELSRAADLNRFVRPACLQTTRIIAHAAYSAIGWGATSFGGSGADHLQAVDLKPFTFEQCSAAYEINARRLSRGIDDRSQLCAGEEARDTCQGDSGGPLQVPNRDFATGYTIIGLTSFGKPCAISAAPSVYTRVSHYVGWIESIVWPDEIA